MNTSNLLEQKSAEIIQASEKLFSLAEGELRDLTEVELEAIEKSVAAVDDLTTYTESIEKEESNMNAPLDLTVLENPAQDLPLMKQIEKALPSIMSGQNFRTEIKAAPVAGTNTTATGAVKIGIPAEFAGLVPTALASPNRLYNLMNKLPASGQSVTYIQVGLGTNTAASVKELALKPENNITATSKNAEILTLASWVEASKQVLSDVAGLQAVLGQTLTEGLLRTVDAHIYTTLTAGATTFTPTLLGSDILAEAVLTIQTAGGQNPIVLLNPADFLKIMTDKTAGSGEYLGVSPMPINAIPCSSVAAGKILAFDRSATAFFERETAGIFVGYSGDQFIRNAVTILSEMRGVAAILNPNLVLTGDLAAPVVPETK
jgi:HK97 family phage major capsid protein